MWYLKIGGERKFAYFLGAPPILRVLEIKGTDAIHSEDCNTTANL